MVRPSCLPLMAILNCIQEARSVSVRGRRAPTYKDVGPAGIRQSASGSSILGRFLHAGSGRSRRSHAANEGGHGSLRENEMKREERKAKFSVASVTNHVGLRLRLKMWVAEDVGEGSVNEQLLRPNSLIYMLRGAPCPILWVFRTMGRFLL